jgi:hypothetical protein
MIDKPLHQITYADIERFIAEKWPESKTLDYKRDPYGNKDDDKKELLKDVSSFANTQGGDIVIGVDEDKGVPTGIPGVTLPDIDKEKLRLDEIIRRGLDPRIEFGLHHVATPASTTVIVIRVRESLLFPHRVVYQGKFGEFWARSSAGKYSMDTDELRRAFTLSGAVYDQMRAFRAERVSLVSKGETPVPLAGGGKLILHLIPVSSFRSRSLFDVASLPDMATRFAPMGTSGWDYRLNLDGHLAYSGGRAERVSRSYTQFFRTGVVEAVISDVVREENGEAKHLLAGYYERVLMEGVPRLMTGFRQVGVEPPLWGFLTISGVKGARISSNSDFGDEYRDIDRDSLFLPEFSVDDLGTDPATLLRPTFDLVWNASGFRRSFNFDEKRQWVGRYG